MVAVAPLAKPVPFTVSIRAPLPATRLAGLSVVIDGVGLTTVMVGLVADRT
jgi:hypothetical protein